MDGILPWLVDLFGGCQSARQIRFCDGAQIGAINELISGRFVNDEQHKTAEKPYKSGLREQFVGLLRGRVRHAGKDAGDK